MLLLVDYWCNKAVILSSKTNEIKVIEKNNLISMIKQNTINIDNITLNKAGTDLVCLSGSLSRLESMPKVVTVLVKTKSSYICYLSSKIMISNKDADYINKIESYSEESMMLFMKRNMTFNAFLRNNSIVIKGPLFSSLDSDIKKVKINKVDTAGKKNTVNKYKGTIIFSDIRRVDGELRPTIFELDCDEDSYKRNLVGILRKEYNQDFMLDGEYLNPGIDSIKHDISCYINFAQKFNLKIKFKIGIYDIDDLMEYAEDMSWTVEQFKGFIDKYNKYKFEMDENIKEILQ